MWLALVSIIIIIFSKGWYYIACWNLMVFCGKERQYIYIYIERERDTPGITLSNITLPYNLLLN